MRYLLVILFGINFYVVFGQPDPCLNGTEESCTCLSAPVLCEFEELDGFSYSMSTFQHPFDGPDPMCPPPAVDNTTSNNPTWFAFIANCPSIDIEVEYSSCTGFGISRGLQAAVYGDCMNLPGSIVSGGCATDWDCTPPPCYGCGVVSGVRILNLTNLIVGKIYYFLVDGCGGSACDVTINVLSASVHQLWEHGLQNYLAQMYYVLMNSEHIHF